MPGAPIPQTVDQGARSSVSADEARRQQGARCQCWQCCFRFRERELENISEARLSEQEE
eukprot:COSAG02_NODE_60016_length_272_cov_0.901734_1_plen_58_part_10